MDIGNELDLISEDDEIVVLNPYFNHNNNDIEVNKTAQDQLTYDKQEDNEGQYFRPSFMQPMEGCLADHNMYEQQEISLDVVKNLTEDFNQLKEDEIESENIKVYLRIRPPPSKEQKQPTSGTGIVSDNHQYIIDDPHSIRIVLETSQPLSRRFKGQLFSEQQFKFSRIFNSESSQSTVFEETTTPLVNAFLRGEKCLIFSYGATNSGKTFTMQGYGTNFGIIPRTLDSIFNQIEEKLYPVGDLKPTNTDGVQELSLAEREILESRKFQLLQSLQKNKKKEKLGSFSVTQNSLESFRDIRSNSSSTICDVDIQNINSVPVTELPDYVSWPKSTKLYSCWISFAEIYNERVYDLFSNNEKEKKSGKVKEIKVVSDGKGGFYMKDLTEFCVKSAEEAYKLFMAGKQSLKFASTKANMNSSRSHSFFNIRIVKIITTGSLGVLVEPKNLKMSFCDLAGVEKLTLTDNVGDRLIESNKINNSLFKLLHCIKELRQMQKGGKKRTIPYRDSKLSQLFSDFLTEKTHISMIVNINPEPKYIESSLSVLHNSAIASGIVSFRNNYVEPPQNNSNFFKKFRESIGYKREDLPNIIEIDEEEEEEEEDGVQQLEERSQQQEEQISFSSSNLETKDEKLTRLELENVRLRNELAANERNVKDSLSKYYGDMIQDIHKNYKERANFERSRESYLNKRKISLSLKIMGVEYQEQLDKVGHTSETVDLTLIEENKQEEQEIKDGCAEHDSEYEDVYEDEKEWEDVKINGEENNCERNLDVANCQKSKLTPICSPIQSQEDIYKTPENETSRYITDYFSQNQDLVRKNEEYEDIIIGLQKSLDDQRKKVNDLQEINKENTKLFEERCKHYEELVETKNREIANFNEENPTKMKEDLLNEIQSINLSLNLKNEEIESLQRDVEDGRITCVEYHRKLETANLRIKELTENINSINSELENVKQEKQISEIKNAEMAKEISGYKAKLGIQIFLTSDEEDDDDENRAPKFRRGTKGRGQSVMNKGSSRSSNYNRHQSISKKKNSTKFMKKNEKSKRDKNEESFNISTLTEEEYDTDAGPNKSPAKRPKEEKIQPTKKGSNKNKNFFSSVSTSSDSSDDFIPGSETQFKRKFNTKPKPRSTKSKTSTSADPSSALRRSSRVKSTQPIKGQK